MTQEFFFCEGENVGADSDVSREIETTHQNSIPQILSPREAAGILRISIKALNNLARSGRIGYVWKNNRERGYYADHLREYLAAREVVATVCGVRRRGSVVPVEPARKSVDMVARNSLPYAPKGGGEDRTRRRELKGKSARASLIQEMQQWQ